MGDMNTRSTTSHDSVKHGKGKMFEELAMETEIVI